MKKVIQLTESDLVSLVSRVLQEQSQSNKIQKGTLLTVIKKNDKLPNPVETQALVKYFYDDGQGGKRAGIEISGQSEVHQPIDLKKMEFGDYKIIKINGQPINQRAKPVKRPISNIQSKPKFVIGQLPKNVQNLVIIKSGGYPITAIKPDLDIEQNNYDKPNKHGYAPRMFIGRGKTWNGLNIELSFKCGMIKSIRIDGELVKIDGKSSSPFEATYTSSNGFENSTTACGEG